MSVYKKLLQWQRDNVPGSNDMERHERLCQRWRKSPYELTKENMKEIVTEILMQMK